MTSYAFTWLQFVFPFYVLLLITLSHYSSRVTKIFGNNPVSALATHFALILQDPSCGHSCTIICYTRVSRLDVYHAPYKRVTRYWTGLTLLMRCIFFMIFALNSRDNDSVNLLIVSSVSASLAALAWMHHGVYEKMFNDILEGAFILNLCIFAAATYHVKQTQSGERQDNVANASVGIAFSIFALSYVHILEKTSHVEDNISSKS